MAMTQSDSLSKEELVKEFLKFSNIANQLQCLTMEIVLYLHGLTNRFDDFIYIRSYWFQKIATLYW